MDLSLILIVFLSHCFKCNRGLKPSVDVMEYFIYIDNCCVICYIIYENCWGIARRFLTAETRRGERKKVEGEEHQKPAGKRKGSSF